jgi:hypothetical protein
MHSRTLWYEIALCFFLSTDEGIVELVTTLILSQKTFAGPQSGTPNTRRLYRKALIISEAMRMATNSDPYVDPSTVFCLLEYQRIGVPFIKISMPVVDLRVT